LLVNPQPPLDVRVRVICNLLRGQTSDTGLVTRGLTVLTAIAAGGNASACMYQEDVMLMAAAAARVFPMDAGVQAAWLELNAHLPKTEPVIEENNIVEQILLTMRAFLEDKAVQV
jgi:hypothetical protein